MNMVKVLLLRLYQCLDPFTMLPVERSSQADFLGIYLTKSFGAGNFGNT